VVIVNVTRDDLRDEFIMADEAFALSPISARASQPREEDYEAISDAFMETSRGRWFLGEYAKRNRNADTRMVLDAVARIEENMAAQKQPAPDNGLAEALVAIRSAVDEARASALAALDGLALQESLAPVRKGARVIREISWRLREIGADGRICDLIDSQLSAIEAGCGQISSADGRSGLSAAFDLIESRIEAFDDSTTTRAFSSEVETGSREENASNKEEPPVEDAVASASPAPTDETAAAAVETAQPAAATNEPEAATNSSALPDETVGAAPEVADVPAEVADTHDANARDVDAHDEAVLDMVAFEMAAPDPSDIDDFAYADSAYADPADTDDGDIRGAEPPRAEPQMIAPAPEPVTVPMAIAPVIQPSLEASRSQLSFERPVEPSPEPSFELPPEPSLEPSLGASLIANGIVRRRQALAPDPLAPIRRMSQADRIALFS
jgi:hypothetical protein